MKIEEDNLEKRKEHCEKTKQWYRENRKKCREWQQAYLSIPENYNRHVLQVAKNNKKWCLANKERISKYSREYYKKNKELLREKWRNHSLTENGIMTIKKSHIKRYYNEKKVVHNFAPKEWVMKIKMTKNMCPLCFQYFIQHHPQRRLTMDHEPALSLVKDNYVYNIDNVTPVCQSCNSSKNKKTLKIDFNKVINMIDEKIKMGVV